MDRTPGALAPLFFITGLAYEAAVRARNALYDSGHLHQRRLQSPVISIGNITMGGTGKTPLAIFTARIILELGFIPVILTRGYGKPDPGVELIINPGKKIQSPVLEMGDEPALIRRHIPEAWFGISKDRFPLASLIERHDGKMAFILDDGFQHRKLHRDLDIVVIDSTQPFGSNRVFPRGTLRESLSGLSRCNAVVLNGAWNREPTADPVESEIRSLAVEANIFHCEQTIERLIPFALWEKAETPKSNAPSPESAFLVTALGNPLRFQRDVLKLGIRITGARFYRDHYRFRTGDWDDCVKRARKTGAGTIIISEKDAVKISQPPDFPLLVADQATRFSDEDRYRELLRRCTLNA